MTSDLIIYGAGDCGRILLWLIGDINRHKRRYNVLGFLDDTVPPGTIIAGVPVLGGFEWLAQRQSPVCCNCAIGNPERKKEAVNRLSGCPSVRFPALIHPSVICAADAAVGEGSAVYSGCVIMPCARLGRHVLVNTGTGIAHDDEIGDFVTLSLGVHIGGRSAVGDCSFVGIGASVSHGVRIGGHTVIGAGAAVVSDIRESCVACGVPARPIRDLEPGQMYF